MYQISFVAVLFCENAAFPFFLIALPLNDHYFDWLKLTGKSLRKIDSHQLKKNYNLIERRSPRKSAQILYKNHITAAHFENLPI